MDAKEEAAARAALDVGRRLSAATDRLSRVLEAQEARTVELAPLRRSDRPYDVLGRQVPRNPFAGQTGAVTLLRAFPGFAGLWTKRVPDEYVASAQDWRDFASLLHLVCRRRGTDGFVPDVPDEVVVVACVCGEHVPLLPGGLAGCGCGRWMLRTEAGVYAKRFEEAPDEV